jgi:hypothetical protein
MAKAKKKGKGKKARHKHVAKRAMIGTFAGGLLGKVLEKILADSIRDFVLPKSNGKKHRDGHHGHKHEDEDVAARLLQALADGGPKPVPQLLADTHLGLSPTLHALQTLRDFRLIHFAGEPGEEIVEATRTGTTAVNVLRQHHIRAEAAKLLAE